ncbi:MAG TPA: hypothetical protein VFL14_11725 [Xanthomonadales bacterium]|nr:hypothetical protein [Xanthomonadales bacterium]
MTDRRPAIAWCVLVVAALTALGYVGELLQALVGMRTLPVAQVAGQSLVSTAMIFASGWVAVSLAERRVRSRGAVSGYLWLVLLMYPVVNILAANGLLLPRVHLRNDQLYGAAAWEITRYLVLIVLIVWAGFSRQLKAHVQSTGTGDVNSPAGVETDAAGR